MEDFVKRMESEGFEVTLLKRESHSEGKSEYTFQLEKKIYVCEGPHHECHHCPPGIYSAENARELITSEVSSAAQEIPSSTFTIEKVDVTLL